MSADKKTVVLGATPNPSRFAYAATRRLKHYGIPTVPVGRRKGEIDGIEIEQGWPDIDDVHTVTLYLNPTNQETYYDYILGLKPKRIIFNPGTENPELMRRARAEGIEVEINCTLVMLSVGAY